MSGGTATVEEMWGRYVTEEASARGVLALPETIAERVKRHEATTGSNFLDMAILRNGRYDPTMVEQYRAIEEQFSSFIGHSVLAVETESSHFYHGGYNRHITEPWRWNFSLAKLGAAQPVVDKDALTWSVPAASYVSWSGTRHMRPNLEAWRKKTGSMPIHDHEQGYELTPGNECNSKAAHNSLLNNTLLKPGVNGRGPAAGECLGTELFFGDQAIVEGLAGRRLLWGLRVAFDVKTHAAFLLREHGSLIQRYEEHLEQTRPERATRVKAKAS